MPDDDDIITNVKGLVKIIIEKYLNIETKIISGGPNEEIILSSEVQKNNDIWVYQFYLSSDSKITIKAEKQAKLIVGNNTYLLVE